MPSYNLPPWVGQPADPALHYGQGFQMGMHLGAQQAAQAFQQQQLAQQQQKMALAQQQQEFENQMQAQVLSLKVGEMARQHQASQMFQQRVAMGEDPTRVLMELAPALGESPATIIRAQAARDNERAMMNFRQVNMARLQQQAQKSLAERQREFDTQQRLKSEQKDVVPVLEEYGGRTYLRNPKTGHVELIDKTIRKPDFVARNITRWMSDTGLDREQAVKEIESFYDSHIAPMSEKKSTGVVGDNTMPDKVVVKGPDGKMYRLPRTQLVEAQKQGYQLVP